MWDKDKWADDSILNSYFSAIEESANSDDVLLLGPSVTAAIKLGTPEVVAESLENTSYNKCKYILFCVSNCTDSDVEDTASHWSLLFLDKMKNEAYHVDSLRPMNSLSAQVIADHLGVKKSNVTEIQCIQQRQSFECGIHVLANAKYITFHYCLNNNSDIPFNEWFNGTHKPYSYNRSPNLKRNMVNRVASINKAAKWCKVTQGSKLKSKTSRDMPVATKNRFEIFDKVTQDEIIGDQVKNYKPQIITTNRKRKVNGSLKRLKKNQMQGRGDDAKITITSDSQGRNLSIYLGEKSNNKFTIFNHCQPGAPLERLTDHVIKSTEFKNLTAKDYVVVVGGTNNVTRKATESPRQFISQHIKYLETTQALFKHTNLIMTNIPYRYDLDYESRENKLIKEANFFLSQISSNNQHVKLLDLWLLERRYHTRHGLHLNQRGKKFICQEIIKIIENAHHLDINDLPSEDQASPPTVEETSPDHKLQCRANPINVLDGDMTEVIKSTYGAPVAFAHCISGDFDNPKQMSRGVAVAFRTQIGRPKRSDCLSKDLTLQHSKNGTAVYGLVTKKCYNDTPNIMDYNIAFKSFTDDFKARNFVKLICSPMGCVRDRIPIQIFSKNIAEFYNTTGADIDVIVQDERATRNRTLRNGLKHHEFKSLLRSCIADELNGGDCILRPTYPTRTARQADPPLDETTGHVQSELQLGVGESVKKQSKSVREFQAGNPPSSNFSNETNFIEPEDSLNLVSSVTQGNPSNDLCDKVLNQKILTKI